MPLSALSDPSLYELSGEGAIDEEDVVVYLADPLAAASQTMDFKSGD